MTPQEMGDALDGLACCRRCRAIVYARAAHATHLNPSPSRAFRLGLLMGCMAEESPRLDDRPGLHECPWGLVSARTSR